MKPCIEPTQQRLQQGVPAETRSLSLLLSAKTYQKGPDLVFWEPLHRKKKKHCFVACTSLDDILKLDKGAANTAELAFLWLTRTLAQQAWPP